MTRVGVLVRFEAVPGSDKEMAAFFREGLPIVETQPTTTVWFAFRVNETTYGAFAAFATAQHREACWPAAGRSCPRSTNTCSQRRQSSRRSTCWKLVYTPGD